MCRNIKPLYNFEPPASDEEIRAAALQYVRKISGFTAPSAVNAEAFERVVDEIARASGALLGALATAAPPKDREVEARRRAPARPAGLARREIGDRKDTKLWQRLTLSCSRKRG